MARSFFLYVFAVLFLVMWALSVYAIALPALPGVGTLVAETFSELWETRAVPVSQAPDALYKAVEAEMLYASDVRDKSKEPFAAIQIAQGKRETRSFLYVKDRDGFLHRGSFYQVEDSRITEYAKLLRSLRERLPQETALLFVGGPPRYAAGQTPVYGGYPVDRRSGRNMEALQLQLFENGVDTLDLNYTQVSALDREALFYKTDSRWTTEGAFLAFQAIADTLEGRYGLPVDPGGVFRDRQNYTATRAPDFILGDMGKSTGAFFSGRDAFIHLAPAVKTAFSAAPYGKEAETVQGRFEDVLSVKAAGEAQAFRSYLGGPEPQIRIQNRLAETGPKVLLIGDKSFAPVGAFLAAAVSELTVVTPGTGSAPSLSRLLREGSYDAVIIGCQPGSIENAFFSYFALSE
ncbi:hypothetical protein LJC32_01750 [Oscillospiraceae bacterium OttesenSCG-928-F05]|nr:hypothetical protein [Oscillospiraceae bacterium OttesenSCG-928-F05]